MPAWRWATFHIPLVILPAVRLRRRQPRTGFGDTGCVVGAGRGLSARDHYGGRGSDRAAARTLEDFKKNRYDPEKRTLEFTEAQAAAFGKVADHYAL